MKNISKYFFGLAASLGAALGMTSCQDDFSCREPELEIPVATLTPNTSILELKQAFWQDDALDYCTKVGAKDDGSNYIISGRVISSDKAGNVYKKLVIQDETAALAISINYNSLYNEYRMGQEIVLDVTGMYIGKYCGMLQLGYPGEYRGQENTSFMPYEMFVEHMQLNGLPDASLIDTMTIRKFSEIPSSVNELVAYQSRLCKFNNVYFAEGGQAEFTTAYKENTNRILYDSDNQSMTVRTSGYATFREVVLPEGYGDVVALLDFYQTSADSSDSPWQLTLNDAAGCMNFGNPTVEPGDEDNPYTVEEVVALESAGNKDRAWVTGYIVGAVAPGVSSVTSNDDIEWTDSPVLASTLVIGPTADCTEYSQCLVVALPQDSPFRQYGNLVDNPSNYKKQIWVYGTFEQYMDTWGITNNSGATTQFKIEGLNVPGGSIGSGDGSENSPYNVGQIISMNPSSTTESPEGGAGVWVSGYIVGYMPSTNTYLTNTVFGIPTDVQTNIVLGPTADCTDYSQCIGIQLPSGAVRTALNLQTNTGNLGRQVALYGDVMKYCGGPGLKNTSKYVLGEGGGDTGGGDTGGGSTGGNGAGTKDSPYDCAKVIALNPSSTTESPEGGAGVWVGGYIVGSIPTTASSTTISEATFDTNNAATTNLVLGPSASTKNTAECITVQLPTGSVRSALNLADNPGNLGQYVLLYGDVMKYCGGPGLKNTSQYELNGGGNTGGGDDTPSTPTEAISVSEAIALINGGSTAEITVKGIISRVTYFNANYGSLTYYISDNGSTTGDLQVYGGLGLNGAKFSAQTDLAVGGTVVVKGKGKLYNGAPEIDLNSVLISYTAPSGGGDTGGGDTGGQQPGGGDNEDETKLVQAFTSGIGLPDGSANVPASTKTYTASNTGVVYEILGSYCNTGYLMLNGKNYGDAYISWSLGFNCTEIVLATTSGCSTNANNKVNFYADGELVQANIATNVQNSTVTISIPAAYQAAGTTYKIQYAGTGYNTQFASFTYVK